jgi:hypothetical protein
MRKRLGLGVILKLPGNLRSGVVMIESERKVMD